MWHRLIIGYVGGIGLPLVLLPLAYAYTLGGHSLAMLLLYGSPLGLFTGLIYSDVKRGIVKRRIVIRCLVSFALLFAFAYLSLYIRIIPWQGDFGYLLGIPFIGPGWTAALSEYFSPPIFKS